MRSSLEKWARGCTNRIPGLDHDHLDACCRHLLVRDPLTTQLIGCTRILTEDDARQVEASTRRVSSKSERCWPCRVVSAEIGRTCVHRDYRNGATITALWSGIANFVVETGSII